MSSRRRFSASSTCASSDCAIHRAGGEDAALMRHGPRRRAIPVRGAEHDLAAPRRSSRRGRCRRARTARAARRRACRRASSMCCHTSSRVVGLPDADGRRLRTRLHQPGPRHRIEVGVDRRVVEQARRTAAPARRGRGPARASPACRGSSAPWSRPCRARAGARAAAPRSRRRSRRARTMRSMRRRPGDVADALEQIVAADVGRDREDLVDGLARPARQVLQGVGRQQQDRAALPLALAQELGALLEGGDAQDRQRSVRIMRSRPS